MKKDGLKNKKWPFVKLGTAVLLMVITQSSQAQSTYSTLFTGDGTNGIENYKSSGITGDLYKVYKSGIGTGSDYVKPKQYPLFVSSDADGNIAVGYNNSNAITRVDKNGKIMVIPHNNNTGTLAIDKNSEFIYVSNKSSGIITRSVWKDTGNESSIGYYSSQTVGYPTEAVKTYPFLKHGDLVARNGVALENNDDMGIVRAMAFDKAGNLFYADASSHVIRKISIINRQVISYAAAGASTLMLNSVAGIDPNMNPLVRGVNLPSATLVGSINGNSVDLINAQGDPAAVAGDGIEVGTTISFITGVDDIAGQGYAGSTLAATAGASEISFTGTVSDNTGLGLAFDDDGNLFFADAGSKRILKITADADGNINSSCKISVFATGFPQASLGIAATNSAVFISTTSDNRIYKFGSEGGAIANSKIIAGSNGRAFVSFNLKTGESTMTIGTGTIAESTFPVNSYLRSTRVPTNTTITAISEDKITATLSNAAISEGASSIVGTSPDGLVTGSTYMETGRLDGAFGLALVKNGTSYDLVFAESNGHHIRKLSNVASIAPMPVTLSKVFTAKLATSGIVDLKWATASEQNNSRFIIKHSIDGIVFTSLSVILSKGADGAIYSTIDFNPQEGNNYYELSQVDMDGTTKILGYQTVKVSLKNTAITIYPNPVNGLEFSIAAPLVNTPTVQVSISNLSGLQVYNKTFIKTEGGVYPIFLGSKLAPGIYVVSINHTNSQKLVVN